MEPTLTSRAFRWAIISQPIAQPSSASKLDSLNQPNRLSNRGTAFHAKLTDFGTVTSMLKCVDSDEPSLLEKDLTLLLNVSLDDDNKVGLVAEGAIARVVAVLQGGSPNSRAMAKTMLTNLAVVEVNKATIGSYPYAIRAFFFLLRDGKGQEKKEAATTLYAICRFRTIGCGRCGFNFDPHEIKRVEPA
ncbi:U-box domain-containing protein 8-like [Rosa chinensis]|uniref:U-box domain-containing protein 8-like n=1 Tax=Rosa chinensis TaxID=74649 RepID=UPI000D087EAE|nr:U-box domain-containing protein 8-like [Rosa chinensis]